MPRRMSQARNSRDSSLVRVSFCFGIGEILLVLEIDGIEFCNSGRDFKSMRVLLSNFYSGIHGQDFWLLIIYGLGVKYFLLG